MFLVFNTHFDHRGLEARKKAAELMIGQIKRFAGNGEPVFFLGDLNSRDMTEAYKMLAAAFNDTYITAPDRATAEDFAQTLHFHSRREARI